MHVCMQANICLDVSIHVVAAAGKAVFLAHSLLSPSCFVPDEFISKRRKLYVR